MKNFFSKFGAAASLAGLLTLGSPAAPEDFLYSFFQPNQGLENAIGKAEAYENAAVKNGQESAKYESIKLTERDQIENYVGIKRGINQLSRGRNAGFYGKLSHKFVGLSENAGLRYVANQNDADLALQIIALAHAGFSSMKAAGFLNYDERNLDNAHLMYKTALQLRRQLDQGRKKQVGYVYVEGNESGINVAPEELHRERIAEILSYLHERKNGDEKEAMKRHGRELYLGLLADTENPTKVEIYKKGLERFGYITRQVSK